uniref:Uncharacterized protein n=1 Tax=Oryza rufipogon TaxID=4529 RepID=A0A0E0MVL4_ORYRU
MRRQRHGRRGGRWQGEASSAGEHGSGEAAAAAGECGCGWGAAARTPRRSASSSTPLGLIVRSLGGRTKVGGRRQAVQRPDQGGTTILSLCYY